MRACIRRQVIHYFLHLKSLTRKKKWSELNTAWSHTWFTFGASSLSYYRTATKGLLTSILSHIDVAHLALSSLQFSNLWFWKLFFNFLTWLETSVRKCAFLIPTHTLHIWHTCQWKLWNTYIDDVYEGWWDMIDMKEETDFLLKRLFSNVHSMIMIW